MYEWINECVYMMCECDMKCQSINKRMKTRKNGGFFLFNLSFPQCDCHLNYGAISTENSVFLVFPIFISLAFALRRWDKIFSDQIVKWKQPTRKEAYKTERERERRWAAVAIKRAREGNSKQKRLRRPSERARVKREQLENRTITLTMQTIYIFCMYVRCVIYTTMRVFYNSICREKRYSLSARENSNREKRNECVNIYCQSAKKNLISERRDLSCDKK